MDKQKFVTKVDETGKKIDDWAEEKAEKHSFTKTQVFVGVFIGLLAVVGVCRLAGWL